MKKKNAIFLNALPSCLCSLSNTPPFAQEIDRNCASETNFKVGTPTWRSTQVRKKGTHFRKFRKQITFHAPFSKTEPIDLREPLFSFPTVVLSSEQRNSEERTTCAPPTPFDAFKLERISSKQYHSVEIFMFCFFLCLFSSEFKDRCNYLLTQS